MARLVFWGGMFSRDRHGQSGSTGRRREQTLKPSTASAGHRGPEITGSLQGSTRRVVFLHLHLLWWSRHTSHVQVQARGCSRPPAEQFSFSNKEVRQPPCVFSTQRSVENKGRTLCGEWIPHLHSQDTICFQIYGQYAGRGYSFCQFAYGSGMTRAKWPGSLCLGEDPGSPQVLYLLGSFCINERMSWQ